MRIAFAATDLRRSGDDAPPDAAHGTLSIEPRVPGCRYRLAAVSRERADDYLK